MSCQQRLVNFMAKTGGITVVDIGTYNIKAALGEKLSDGFKILSYSTVKSNGFSGGKIVDVIGLRASIGEALGELQSQMTKKIPFGDLIVTGSSNVFSMERIKVEKTLSKDKAEPIKESHVRTMRLEAGKRENTIDVIVMNYTLDDGRVVINPVSMMSTKITADMILVKIDEMAQDEFFNLFEGYNFTSASIAHPGILAAEGVLNENEKDRGILCLEMGYATTKIISYEKGVPVEFQLIPLGVQNIVKDIATVFKVSYSEAERLLFYHSNLDYKSVKEDETVETTDFDAKTKKNIKKRSLSLTAYARSQEIFSIARREFTRTLNKASFNPVGLVITGGGASIPGIAGIGSSVFNITARTGAYASSNNVIVNGAEDIMAVPAYTLLFGAFVHLFKHGFNVRKAFRVSPISKTPAISSDKNENENYEDGFLKKVWEFLKKLV